MLRTILIKLAKRIGRWIVRKLSCIGFYHLIGYMRGRIDTFKRRRTRMRSKLRKKWLLARIRRWQWAIRLMMQHRTKLTHHVANAVDTGLEKALKRIPWNATCENYRRWCRAQ